MRNVCATSAIIISFLTLPAAIAKEGFSASLKDAPLAVQKVWRQTFGVVRNYSKDGLDRFNIGSAFLFGKSSDATMTTLVFLTANHVLDDKCSWTADCDSQTVYSNFNLSSSLDFKSLPDMFIKTFNLIFYGYNLRTRGQFFEKIRVFYRNKDWDAAAFSINIKNDLATDIPEPIQFANSCDLTIGDPLYQVGFPMLTLRKDQVLLTISKADRITKRWTQGEFGAILNVTNEGKQDQYLGDTLDSLPGVSGGPIVNFEGKVVSFSQLSRSIPENKFAYQGLETPTALRTQSYGIECKKLKAILRR